MQPSESGTRKDLVFHRIETAKEVNEQIATAEEFIALVEQYCRRELQND